MSKITKNDRRTRRKLSIRKKIHGVPGRPRLTVYKSGKNIFAQLIDDSIHHTICSASTLDKSYSCVSSSKETTLCNIENAKKIGEILGMRAHKKNIKKVCFDRNGYPYHGVLKALADAFKNTGIIM